MDGLVGGAGGWGDLAIAVALVLPGNWHIVIAGVVVSGVAALVLGAGVAMRTDVWLVIAGMAVADLSHPGAPCCWPWPGRPLPPRLRLWLRLIPLAVLPALAAAADPGRSRPANGPLPRPHPPLWGAVVVFVLAAWRVNLFADHRRSRLPPWRLLRGLG